MTEFGNASAEFGNTRAQFGNVTKLAGDTLPNSAQWRDEVIKNGKYFIYRRGSKDKREYRWGGNADALGQERLDRWRTRSDKRRILKEARDVVRNATGTGNDSAIAMA